MLIGSEFEPPDEEPPPDEKEPTKLTAEQEQICDQLDAHFKKLSPLGEDLLSKSYHDAIKKLSAAPRLTSPTHPKTLTEQP
jgi:hypothetical protein